MRHSFDIVLGLTLGAEEEHFAKVTGQYHRAQPAYTPRGECAPIDPPEPALFEIGSVTAEIKGKTVDLIPLLTEAQMRAIEEEGVGDASCLPIRRMAAE